MRASMIPTRYFCQQKILTSLVLALVTSTLAISYSRPESCIPPAALMPFSFENSRRECVFQQSLLSTLTKTNKKIKRQDQSRCFGVKKSVAIKIRGGASKTELMSLSNKAKNLIADFISFGAETYPRAWAVLMIAILLDMVATVTLEIAAKHSSIRSVSIAAFFYLSSMLMFGISLKKLDVSIAYAVWASLGTALISLVGILFFGEDCHTKKIISLVLIVLGTVGLNMK